MGPLPCLTPDRKCESVYTFGVDREKLIRVVCAFSQHSTSMDNTNVPSLQLFSLLVCPSLPAQVPTHLTDATSPLMAEVERFRRLYVAELCDMTQRRIANLEEHASLDELIEAEGLREYYARLSVVRRVEAAYDRLPGMLNVHRRRGRILEAFAGYTAEFERCAASFDVDALLNKVEDLAITCEESDTIDAIRRALDRMCDDYEGFVRRVCQTWSATHRATLKRNHASIEGVDACKACKALHDIASQRVDDIKSSIGGLRRDTLWEMRRRLLLAQPTPAMVALLFAPELKWVPTYRFLAAGSSLREDVSNEEFDMGEPGALTWMQMSRLAVMQLVGHASPSVGGRAPLTPLIG